MVITAPKHETGKLVKNFMRLLWLFVFLFILFLTNFLLVKEGRIVKKNTLNSPKIHVKAQLKAEDYSQLRVTKEKQKTKDKKEIIEESNLRKNTERKPERLTQGPKVAIVIDDFGYNFKIAELFAQLDAPITFSILPRLAYSGRIAVLANSSGKKVMLHLPMEPHAITRIEPFMIMRNMTKEKIRAKFEENISSVPYAEGVNNHEGSRACENYFVMKTVLEECQNRGLFFLDSLTSYSSTGEAAARDLGFTIHHRDIFLDNKDNVNYILNKLNELTLYAEKYGYAIGIGHARRNTADALKKFYDENKDNINFIFVEELYK